MYTNFQQRKFVISIHTLNMKGYSLGKMKMVIHESIDMYKEIQKIEQI